MKYFTPIFFILFFISCNNYNDKMTEFINEEKSLKSEIDSIDRLMQTNSFIDTFTIDQTTPEISEKRKLEYERLEKLSESYRQKNTQLKAIRFSIDSLSKMK